MKKLRLYTVTLSDSVSVFQFEARETSFYQAFLAANSAIRFFKHSSGRILELKSIVERESASLE